MGDHSTYTQILPKKKESSNTFLFTTGQTKYELVLVFEHFRENDSIVGHFIFLNPRDFFTGTSMVKVDALAVSDCDY